MKTAFAVDEHTLVIAEVAKFVRFDLVFLGFGKIHTALASTRTPRPFDHLFFAQEIGGLNGIRFIGGAENHPVAQVECQHL